MQMMRVSTSESFCSLSVLIKTEVTLWFIVAAAMWLDQSRQPLLHLHLLLLLFEMLESSLIHPLC